jgi:predicted enzyme related to lactoylglutathione lyase
MIMTTPILGSILLGSTNPQRLQAWYQAAFAPTYNADGFMIFGGVNLLIDQRDDIHATNSEPGRLLLNFHVEDAHAVASHVTKLGVTWLVELEERDDGLFGTLVDPDGNYIQIIQFTNEYHARQNLRKREHG